VHHAAQFTTERDWERYHTGSNITLAVAGEVGVPAECFQWKGDGALQLETNDVLHVGEEIADIAIYLARLATESSMDKPRMPEQLSKFCSCQLATE